MKIYTGTGDGGKTSLFSGERLKKSDMRVATYGTVDELCSFIGVVEATLWECPEKTRLAAELHSVQADLFTIGALLSTSMDSPNSELLKPITQERIDWLEDKIDAMQSELKEIRSFVLPGGHVSAAWAQVVRTICRRAEREIILLADKHGCLLVEVILGYMNRLSDFFFVLARYLNNLSGTEEISWHG